MFNALCSGFSTAPSICAASLGNYQPDFLEEDSNIGAGTIVALVIVLILINLLIWYCYRRSTKREMQGEMQMQIESAVSQYFALSQKEGGRVSVRWFHSKMIMFSKFYFVMFKSKTSFLSSLEFSKVLSVELC